MASITQVNKTAGSLFDSWAEIAIKANKTIQQRAEMSKDCAGNGM